MIWKKQGELNIQRQPRPDRNFDKGGRSFYFFDLDDNVLRLPSKTYLYKKGTGEEVEISSSEYSIHSHLIGIEGKYKDYDRNMCELTGTYRRFRGHTFKEDIEEAIKKGELFWKGPSWECFYHAVFNGRPISLITARGHAPEILKEGFDFMTEAGLLPRSVEFLTLYPVSYPETRIGLGDKEFTWSVPELKRQAIFHSVRRGFELHGPSPHHRFGMSDDSVKNLEMIHQAMRELKSLYPQNSFSVIETQDEKLVKCEVHLSSESCQQAKDFEQLELLFSDFSIEQK